MNKEMIQKLQNQFDVLSRKEPIAFAQSYFAIQTRKQERRVKSEEKKLEKKSGKLPEPKAQ